MIQDLAIGVVANICFKMLENGASFVKEKFVNILRNDLSLSDVNDQNLKNLANCIEDLNINEDMSVRKIEKLIADNDEIIKLLSKINKNSDTKKIDIKQVNVHGDNVINGINI